MEDEEKIVIIMGFKIPTYYDVAISLFMFQQEMEIRERKLLIPITNL